MNVKPYKGVMSGLPYGVLSGEHHVTTKDLRTIELFDSRRFTYSNYLVLPAQSSIVFQIETNGKTFVMERADVEVFGGIVEAAGYANGSVISNGTPITAHNRNQANPVQSTASLFTAPVVDSLGDRIVVHYFVSGTGGNDKPNKVSLAGWDGADEFILAPASTNFFKLENFDTTNQSVITVRLDFREVDY
jgi:hypothetical protein